MSLLFAALFVISFTYMTVDLIRRIGRRMDRKDPPWQAHRR